MEQPGPWRRANELRDRLPAEVVAAIDAVDRSLPADADAQATIAALRSHGLDFSDCLVGVVALRGVSLGEAKLLVHRSDVLAAERQAREQFWAHLHAELDAAVDRGEIQRAD